MIPRLPLQRFIFDSEPQRKLVEFRLQHIVFVCLPNAMQFSRPVFSLGGMCTCGCKGRNDVLFACAVYYFSNLVSKTFERFFLFPTYFRKVPAIFLLPLLKFGKFALLYSAKWSGRFLKMKEKRNDLGIIL